MSSLESVIEDFTSLCKLGRSDVHVHTLILAETFGRREEMHGISRLLQQVERQEPRNVSSDKDMSALFYSLLHSAISAMLEASSLDWFVASPSAAGQMLQHAGGRGISDGIGGGGSTTHRSEGWAGDNSPSWLTMDGQVCRWFFRLLLMFAADGAY
jgi:hypothetical protein